MKLKNSMKLKNQNLQHLGFIALAGISPFALQSAQAASVYWDTNGATGGASAGTTANGT